MLSVEQKVRKRGSRDEDESKAHFFEHETGSNQKR